VEAGTAKLSDCRTKLETNRSAGATPPLRTELAERYNLGYLDVARGIDTFVAEQEQNSKATLDQVFKRMFT